MSWSNVLEGYARMKNPLKELGDGVYLISDDKTLTIFDGYEKAKYHFLVLPRDPFPLSINKTLPSTSLVSLNSLLKSPHALEVLKVLEATSEEVVGMIQDEMEKSEGWIWDVQVGFHASESMRHVHLHIISLDLISPSLKNKKHYNSFHPSLGFFLPLSSLISTLSSNRLYIMRSKTEYEAMLKEPLVSHWNDEEFGTIPKLKDHLVKEWERKGREAKKGKEKEKGG